jgi:hypothetical protein
MAMATAHDLNRRRFLLKTALLLAGTQVRPGAWARAASGDRARVVRVSSPRASGPWDYQPSAPWDHSVEPRSEEELNDSRFRQDRYFDQINEAVVLELLTAGLLELTGRASARQAWLQLLAGYRPGDRITIKVNLNNASYHEAITTNRMDQSAQAINAVIASLVSSLQVPEQQITVADPSRWIHPVIVRQRCAFPHIKWVDSRSADLWDPSEQVVFSRDQPVRPDIPPNLPEAVDFFLARVYTETEHIINLCLLKNHGCGVTGAMKNHFGAIPPPAAKFFHTGLGHKSYIADLCNTPSIRNKVRVNICEAIFGNWHNNVWSPRPWRTFPGGTPNSLFLGTDPVAFDSVLLQHITSEVTLRGDTVDAWVRTAITDHDFLQYAMDYHRLGIHEHEPFNRIDYRQVALS